MVRSLVLLLIIAGSTRSLCAQVVPHSAALKNTKHLASQGKRPLQVSLIQGVWSDSLENNAIFYIEGKRVKFFDHIGDDHKEYVTYWKIVNDKLSFCYSGGLVVTDNIIKLTKDSLVLYRKDIGFSRYVRLK